MHRTLAALSIALAATLAFASDSPENRQLTTDNAARSAATDNRQPTTDNAPRSGAHFIVTPARVLTPADIADLATRGIDVQRVLPGPRYLVRMANAVAIENDPRVRSIERLAASHKIAPAAAHEAAQAMAFIRVRLLFNDEVSFADAASAIEDAGGTIEQPLQSGFDLPHGLTARIPSTSVMKLANDDRVFGIYGPPHRIAVENATAAALSHVTPLYSAPYNLSGAGVVVSMFDIGKVDASHPEFSGRVTVQQEATSEAVGDHPTHVAGTMIAQGINPEAKGMAPAATLQDFSANDPNMLGEKQNNLAPLSVVADNNSWGYVLGWCDAANCETTFPVWNGADELIGGYDALDSSPYDAMARQTPVLFVHSAGNDASVGISPVIGPWFQHLHVDPNSGNPIKNEIF
ncbi:MAG TPA: S8 family serine peptidase, partial [Thermoanaerobaculia bacterium]|nr:S8 family serine peptidase [Thermoanaerobaculia bacterium]